MSRGCWSWLAMLTLLLAPVALPALDLADRLNPTAKVAIDKALVFLADNQRADGSFNDSLGATSGVVASVQIAFMAAGQVPGEGAYGQVTAKATQYLLSCAQSNGLLFRPESGGPPMYHHGLATLALAEVWGMTADPRVRNALQKAVDLICSSQNSKGGWRYQPKIADDDLSVTVMQLMALRAARDAGIAVPKEVIDAGIDYVKHCHNPKSQGKDGGFGYMPGSGSGLARTGAGVTSLQVAGDYRSTEVQEGIDYLLGCQPLGKREEDNREFRFYGLYYATAGIYLSQSIGTWGKNAWNQWYPAVVKQLTNEQKPNGKWEGAHGLYNTAMGVVILSIPYRYLPLYQR
jgi:Prenyltransferase and squalene oxidase repeat